MSIYSYCFLLAFLPWCCHGSNDFCASNPCKNGGTCVNGQNSYICNCTDDYTGINCEKCQVELCQSCCKCICQNCCGCILCCVLCLILSIGVSVACVIAATYILQRKKIINICKVPVIGKCFEKKNAKGDESYNNTFKSSQTEMGYESIGLGNTNRADNKSDGGREESPADKKTLPENLEKHELPFLGKCFKDKSKNTDNVDAKQMEPLQTENGHNPESEKTDKHGKNIGDEPEVHREGSPINKNKLSKNSEKGDDIVTTGTPIVEVDGKRLSVNNGENLNDNKYTEVNVESSAM